VVSLLSKGWCPWERREGGELLGQLARVSGAWGRDGDLERIWALVWGRRDGERNGKRGTKSWQDLD
jgi:hypothetical protein